MVLAGMVEFSLNFLMEFFEEFLKESQVKLLKRFLIEIMEESLVELQEEYLTEFLVELQEKSLEEKYLKESPVEFRAIRAHYNLKYAFRSMKLPEESIFF